MRKVGIALAILLGLFAAVGIAQFVAAESGEVVVLHTQAAGESQETRLWIVDQEGSAWLRGRREAGWFPALEAQPAVEVTRDDRRLPFTAVAVDAPEARDRINRAMRDKYGFADLFISWLVGDPDREGALAIRLDPRPLPPAP